MADELHILSLVVHCRPGHAADLAARIGALSGVEIRGGTAEGKLVVLLETSSEAEIVDRLNEIQLIEGVLAATLVFHRCEPTDPNLASIGGTTSWTSHAGTRSRPKPWRPPPRLPMSRLPPRRKTSRSGRRCTSNGTKPHAGSAARAAASWWRPATAG